MMVHVPRATIRRRRLIALLSLIVGVALVAGAVAFVTGSGSRATATHPADTTSGTTSGGKHAKKKHSPGKATAPLDRSIQAITPRRPGPAVVISSGPTTGHKVALTFDDGFCPACVKRIVDVLERTGAHATFFPNGRYGASWDPQAARIRALVQRGQLTLGNHTFSHGVSTVIGPAALGADLQRNEDWIERTFHLTGRPWFRPPYGDYNAGTLTAAGQLGYTKVIMWSGTLADSSLQTPAYLLRAIHYWARPGRIILMHANYLPTAQILPKILAGLARKHLTPVTIAELLHHG